MTNGGVGSSSNGGAGSSSNGDAGSSSNDGAGSSSNGGGGSSSDGGGGSSSDGGAGSSSIGSGGGSSSGVPCRAGLPLSPFHMSRRAGMDKSCLLMVQLMSDMPTSPYKSPYFKSKYLNN